MVTTITNNLVLLREMTVTVFKLVSSIEVSTVMLVLNDDVRGCDWWRQMTTARRSSRTQYRNLLITSSWEESQVCFFLGQRWWKSNCDVQTGCFTT